TLLGIVTLVFAFLHLVPGDPVEIMLGESGAPADVAALRRELGLDRPLPAQYARFLARAARGDLGRSIALRTSVARAVAGRYPATLELAGAAFALALGLALPLGVAAALRPGSAIDRGARLVSLAGACLPGFWLGPLLVQAIDARDYPLVQGCVLAIGVTYVGINTATDLLQRALDPRLRDAR